MANQQDINSFLYQLYQDTPLGSISIECRKKYNFHDQTSFVYGDSHLPSLSDIIGVVKPKPEEVFYDLGSGGGRVVMFAAMSFPFAKCIGVELLDSLADISQKKLRSMQDKIVNFENFDTKNLGEIEFRQEDFTKTDLRDADVIYAASTCFDEKLMRALAQNIESQVNLGARIITCTKCLPSDKFKVIDSKLFDMEWGQVTIFFQERI